jgi:hypothetical protein
MRKQRQIELLERVAAAGPHLRGLHAPASMVKPARDHDPVRKEVIEKRFDDLLDWNEALPAPGYRREARNIRRNRDHRSNRFRFAARFFEFGEQ